MLILQQIVATILWNLELIRPNTALSIWALKWWRRTVRPSVVARGEEKKQNKWNTAEVGIDKRTKILISWW